MNRIVTLTALLLASLLQAQAQTPTATKRQTFTAVASSTATNLIGSGVAYHQVSWNVTGTVSSCAAQVQQSATGTGSWTTLIDIPDCSTNGSSAIVNSTVNYIRLNVSTFSGSSTPTVTLIYNGYINNPAGGGGTPGGSSGQIQYNNAGSFGGITGSSASGANVILAGAFSLSGTITPTELTASVNNYSPTGLSGARTIVVSADADSYSITGLDATGVSDGREITIQVAYDSTYGVTIPSESVSSTAANRFSRAGIAPIAYFEPGANITFRYSTAASRWIEVGRNADLGTWLYSGPSSFDMSTGGYIFLGGGDTPKLIGITGVNDPWVDIQPGIDDVRWSGIRIVGNLSVTGTYTGTWNSCASLDSGCAATFGATTINASGLTLSTGAASVPIIGGPTASSTGFIRIRNAECINWRNSENNADESLCVDASEVLTYSGVIQAEGFTATGSGDWLPNAAGTINLGSATLPFETIFFSGTSGTPASNNFQLTGASTSGTRVVTFPDSNTNVPIIGQVITISGPSAARTYTFPNANATMSYTVASGDIALATSEIASEACSSAQTDTATGTATTDSIAFTFAADPTAVTGYAPVTEGGLYIVAYPTSNTVNFKVCNPTAAPITPGAITLNWIVVR